MGKVIDTTNIPTPYEILTQTPKNMVRNNYYLRELQEKVWADWEYRPNRVDVEQEKTIGADDYFPLEVVIQNIRNDKGEKVSDDYKKLVFRDIHYHVRLGTKFRFSFAFDLEEPNEDKNVWLVTNRDSTTPTASVVITRCNGTLGSIYIDANGKSHYHYEPCIFTTDLKSVNFYYSNKIVTQESRFAIVVQHNQYTRDYFVNQRFIIGYDKVYKVKALDKFNALSTYNPEDVDTVVLYVEIDEQKAQDDFVNRIAFNKDDDPKVEEEPVEGDYHLEIIEPTPLPQELFSQPIQFHVGVFNGETETNIPVTVVPTLALTENPDNYFELVQIDSNTFTLRRRKVYTRGDLVVKIEASIESISETKTLTKEFQLSLRGWE